MWVTIFDSWVDGVDGAALPVTSNERRAEYGYPPIIEQDDNKVPLHTPLKEGERTQYQPYEELDEYEREYERRVVGNYETLREAELLAEVDRLRRELDKKKDASSKELPTKPLLRAIDI